MDSKVYSAIEANPIIAAIKDDSGLERVLKSDIGVVFVLYGDIMSIPLIVEKLKEADKLVFVHLDLISGLSSNKEISLEYLKYNTKTDGVISTKPDMIRKAKELKLAGILRVFIIDSMALSTIKRQISLANADAVEILPGIMPRIIQKVFRENKLPTIAGGLISSKEDLVNALKAGAIAVSSTNEKVWFM